LLLLLVTGVLLSAQTTDPLDLSLSTLRGEKLHLADYRGKVVLVDFFASWCVPCRSEIPHFIRWQSKYGPDRFQVIGISMDDSEKDARTFVTKLKIAYPVAMGNEKLAESFGGVLGLPANFIIGRNGKVAAKHVGETDLNALEKEIQSQLAGKD
jgi:thiol-disulfide isomerase/thioredoxin